jgi:hypothetical protein
MPSDPWGTSVNELAFIFRDALRALIPIAERARLHWKEPNNYDDWDSIAAAIYGSIVISSLEFAIEWHKFDAIPKYRKRIASYSHSSFLTPVDKPGAIAFVCFETRSEPFDTCLFTQLDNEGATELGI